MQPPDTRYARREDGVHIAYQVVGTGPVDLLFAPGFVSHLDFAWTDPGFTRFIEGLTAFARVILYDKPGTGLSDPLAHVPTLEERADDIGKVLEAAGARTPAVLLGFSEAGPAAVLFAAREPDRVQSLLLIGTFARVPPEGRTIPGVTAEESQLAWDRLHAVIADWGRGRIVEMMAPSLDSALNRRFWGRFERAAASPSMLRGIVEVIRQIDVREVARTVEVPALVIHSTDDPIPIGGARELASLLPNGRFVELPGANHAFWAADVDPVLAEIRAFVTGRRQRETAKRVLTTVLFTDIVDSTARAAALGDRSWRDVLDRHNHVVERCVAAAGGRVVKFIGDGVLAVLPGPAVAVEVADDIMRRVGDELALQLRAGVHTGECEPLGDDVAGLAVHIGARVSGRAGPGEIMVSSVVRELVGGAGLEFEPRGLHELKGVPGSWELHAVRRGDGAPQRLPAEAPRPRLGDRMAVATARRAPGVLRAIARRTRPVRAA